MIKLDSIEINKAMYYCKKKCGTIDCTDCEYVFSSDNCEAYFIYDLYDIVDTKTLELNNTHDTINNINLKFFNKCTDTVLKSYQYAIVDLFINDRYKLTKKENHNEILEKVLNI